MKCRSFLFFGSLLLILCIILGNGCCVFKNYKKFLISTVNASLISQKTKNRLYLRLLWNRIFNSGVYNYYFNLYPSWDSDCNIFISNRVGTIKKVNMYTGRDVWVTNLSFTSHRKLFFKQFTEFFSGGMAVNDNRLYIGSELAKVYALNTNTGGVLWATRVSGEILSSPAVGCGLVFVYTGNGKLQALYERSGFIKWTVDLLHNSEVSFRVKSAPVVTSDFVIFGDSNGVVSVCNIDNGELIWQKKIINNDIFETQKVDRLCDIVTTPVVLNNTIYVVACNGNLVALDLLSGELIWSNNVGSLYDIAVENGFIYLVDRNSSLIAFRADNGSVIWSRNDLSYRKQLTSPIVYKNFIFIGDTGGYLYWLNKKDGSLIGKEKMTGIGMFVKPVIIYNILLIYGSSGKVYAWTLMIND